MPYLHYVDVDDYYIDARFTYGVCSQVRQELSLDLLSITWHDS